MDKSSSLIRSAAIALVASCVLITVPLARAQTTMVDPGQGADQQNVPSKAPGDKATTPLRNDTPEPLSKKLENSDGVITPPEHVDPEMRKPTPELGPQSTPVIPPPGTPENNPQVQPK
jgi:hypothetical protein